MGHALRCFREGRTILQACMEVFIREPSINWLVSARNRVLKDDGVEVAGKTLIFNYQICPLRLYLYINIVFKDVCWEPAYRISVASRKLDGANPRALFADDLRSGKIAAYPEYLAGYLKLLAGENQHNVRSRLADEGLTAEEQVQCLLDMATDPALLGISWTGMQPWI